MSTASTAPPAPTQTTTPDPSAIPLVQEPLPTGDPPIRPFSFHASDEDLAELKRRVADTTRS